MKKITLHTPLQHTRTLETSLWSIGIDLWLRHDTKTHTGVYSNQMDKSITKLTTATPAADITVDAPTYTRF